ncbi:MAG: SapB/AmfS family lanthipeptide [Nostoc sp.]|uniref:SapB/AmfS family lanthipeptide n=1 Tax=Nostoc sp. TaxID=1180 RepID=UPI002FFD4E4F
MINPKNNDKNNGKNNDITVAGTDFFADSENFLNELTDSESVQITGGFEVGTAGGSRASLLLCGDSSLSITTCN